MGDVVDGAETVPVSLVSCRVRDDTLLFDTFFLLWRFQVSSSSESWIACINMGTREFDLPGYTKYSICSLKIVRMDTIWEYL